MDLLMAFLRSCSISPEIRERMTWIGGFCGVGLAVVLPSLPKLLDIVQVIGALSGVLLTWIAIVTAWRRLPPRKRRDSENSD